MAYNASMIEDDEDKKNQGLISTPGQSSGGLISSGPVSSVAGTGNQANQPAGTRSGSFTNLIDYVNANKGQDARMGKGIEDVVAGKSDAAKNAIGTFEQNANQRIASGTPGSSSRVVDQLKRSPTAVDKDEFQRSYNATYAGPRAVADVEGLSDVDKSLSNLSDVRRQAGGDLTQRSKLLADIYKAPTYSQGEKNLDSFIVGAGADGVQSLKRVNEAPNVEADSFANLKNMLGGKINEASQAATANRDAVRQAYDSTLANYDQRIGSAQSNLAATNQAREADYEDLLRSLAQGQRGADIGLADGAAQYHAGRGVDFSSMIKRGQNQGLGDVVSRDDQQSYMALRNLLNQGSNYQFDSTGADVSPYVADQEAINRLNHEYLKPIEDQRKREEGARAAQEAGAMAQATQDQGGFFFLNDPKQEAGEKARRDAEAYAEYINSLGGFYL